MYGQCRLVHTVHNKCAFIKTNCPDEEAGLFSYLDLYYCKLPKAKPFAFTILVVWLALLFSTIGIAASDFFCINLSTIAGILGMSESMAGVTFLAFGNGSPDVFSTFAAMSTHSGSLAVGELVGAAGFITAVVAGSMALVRPFKVARKSFVRDVGFFIVAASFSMVFLADGHLHLWECIVMVAFYLFYVGFVLAWHWYLGKKRREKARDKAARSHFNVEDPEEPAIEDQEGDNEDGPAGQRRISLGPSDEDFAALERGNSLRIEAPEITIDANADDYDDTRERYLAEISSSMRVSQPQRGQRRNTVNAIRPSLVGALEFNAVLSSLQKSRNLQTIPLGARRYSDDPTFTGAQQQEVHRANSVLDIGEANLDAHDLASDHILRPSLDADIADRNPVRAVSANDAVGLRLNTQAFRNVPQIDLLGATPPGTGRSTVSEYFSANAREVPEARMVIPDLTVSGSPDDMSPHSTETMFAAQKDRGGSSDYLAPPRDQSPGSRGHDRSERYLDDPSSPRTLPKLDTAPRIRRTSSARSFVSQASSPSSPFPPYRDISYTPVTSRPPSILLPPPSIGSESLYSQEEHMLSEEKPLRWWPYKILPSPRILVSTLFPTLYSWHEKNIWEKLLGIVAAPSVFLLAITLPVVEHEREDAGPDIQMGDPDLIDPNGKRSRSSSKAASLLPQESPTIDDTGDAYSDFEDNGPNPGRHGNHGLGSPSPVIKDSTKLATNFHPSTRQETDHSQREFPPSVPQSSPKEWNRWLVSTQVFTAPFFIVLLVWANTDPTFSIRNLLLPMLYGLIASLLSFAFILLITTPVKPPRQRFLLCFVGFVVSIAWISTIANEVVGVLKAFGVILGISDAILGLTIFAVGNSLGDLVADVTVARLGYPVMALSACFGGPMLNILLGIGLSGAYMTIRDSEGRHEKHPDRPMKYKPYAIEVSSTLAISGATLLVTLLGLLVVVPLNKWKMDRKIGWGLVVLWCTSTIGNLAVEIAGYGGEIFG